MKTIATDLDGTLFKGETLIDGDIRIKSGSETITVTKDDLKDKYDKK